MITFITYLGNIAFGVFVHCELIEGIARGNASWSAFYAVMCTLFWVFALVWSAERYGWL